MSIFKGHLNMREEKVDSLCRSLSYTCFAFQAHTRESLILLLPLGSPESPKCTSATPLKGEQAKLQLQPLHNLQTRISKMRSWNREVGQAPLLPQEKQKVKDRKPNNHAECK